MVVADLHTTNVKSGVESFPISEVELDLLSAELDRVSDRLLTEYSVKKIYLTFFFAQIYVQPNEDSTTHPLPSHIILITELVTVHDRLAAFFRDITPAELNTYPFIKAPPLFT